MHLPVGHKVLLEPNANQRLEATTMTKLTFYGGVNEIGGNKILLEDKKPESFWISGTLSLSALTISLDGFQQEESTD